MPRLPDDLWMLRQVVPVPGRTRLVGFLSRLWRDHETRSQVARDLMADGGPGSDRPRLLYALLAIHRLQSANRALRERVEELELELELALVEVRVVLDENTPEVRW